MKRIVLIAVSAVMVLYLGGCGASDGADPSTSPSRSSTASAFSEQSSSASSATTAAASSVSTVFGTPRVVDVKSGNGATVVGKCGVFHASTEDCTPENLATWYGDYVDKNSHNWDVIVFTNKSGYGVYAGAGVIEVDVKLEADTDGSYSAVDSGDATTYIYDSGTQSLTEL